MEFWAVSQQSFVSPHSPGALEPRLRAALAASQRPRIAGSVAQGRLRAFVRPLSYRADLHPRLIAVITATPGGSTLDCRVAPRRWAIVTVAAFCVFLAAMALFSLAAWIDPAINSRAHEPLGGFLALSLGSGVCAVWTAALLWAARHDRAILIAFVRQAVEAKD